MTDALRALEAKLAEAKAPSRELDDALWHQYWLLGPEKGWRYDLDDPPTYTSSLDAAVAFAEATLPGWNWGVTCLGEIDVFNPGGVQAFVTKSTIELPTESTFANAEGQLPALVLCLATIRALLAKETG